MSTIKVCEHTTYAFQILGRKWNAIILDSMSGCPDCVTSFSELKASIANITPKALSLKLTELIEFGVVEKAIIQESQPAKYRLTKKGIDLAASLDKVQEWAKIYIDCTEE